MTAHSSPGLTDPLTPSVSNARTGLIRTLMTTSGLAPIRGRDRKITYPIDAFIRLSTSARKRSTKPSM